MRTDPRSNRCVGFVRGSHRRRVKRKRRAAARGAVWPPTRRGADHTDDGLYRWQRGLRACPALGLLSAAVIVAQSPNVGAGLATARSEWRSSDFAQIFTMAAARRTETHGARSKSPDLTVAPQIASDAGRSRDPAIGSRGGMSADASGRRIRAGDTASDSHGSYLQSLRMARAETSSSSHNLQTSG